MHVLSMDMMAATQTCAVLMLIMEGVDQEHLVRLWPVLTVQNILCTVDGTFCIVEFEMRDKNK